MKVSDKHAPIRHRKVRSEYKPWPTQDIQKLNYNRDYLKQKAVKLGSSIYNEAYKKYRNYVNLLIKTTKSSYYNSKLLNAKNSKASWKIINELSNRQFKTTTINNLQVDGNNITGDKNIAETFNQYFSNIGPNLANNIPSSGFDPLIYMIPTTNVFHFRTITQEDLKSALNLMKTSKSDGHDKISAKLLKERQVTH